MECENCKRIQLLLDGANNMISAIERMYPNWHRFRDIAEAIEIHTSAQDSIIARLRQDNDQLRTLTTPPNNQLHSTAKRRGE